MNKITLFLLLLVSAARLSGQEENLRPVGDPMTIQQAIVQQSENTTSLTAAFKQEKHLDMMEEVLLSQGRFIFRKPNSVRWQYTTPIDYTLVMHNGRFTINNAGREQEYDMASNPMFSEINNMIITAIRGDFVGSHAYQATYFETGDHYVARLIPASDQVRKLIDHIDIWFTADQFLVDRVRFAEPGGDYTLILFHDIRLNTTVDDAEFNNHTP